MQKLYNFMMLAILYHREFCIFIEKLQWHGNISYSYNPGIYEYDAFAIT